MSLDSPEETKNCIKNEDDLKNILPSEWKYEVIKKIVFGTSLKKTEVTLKVALFCAEDVRLWVRALEERAQCTYSIRSTEKCTGERVQFKQRLFCHRNTRCKKICDRVLKNRTKNTKCPSTLHITLRTVKKVYRGRDARDAPDPTMPCMIAFVTTHNHDIDSGEALRFRRVGENTKQKLMDLYNLGHTPATALESLKMDIQLAHVNYEELLGDRSICPDYSYCYYIYMKEFKKLSIDLNDKRKNFLMEKLEEYNNFVGEICAKVDMRDSDYVITLCPPLFKRIHRLVNFASEIVYLNSASIVEQEGGKVYILSTRSHCGELPLGVIITSAENVENITLGFEALIFMLGDTIFNGKIEGPEVFMTDDREAEHAAIKAVWSSSKCILCVFQVLQAVYRWLVSSENAIPRDTAVTFFEHFKSIMYAATTAECEKMYIDALESAKQFEAYMQFLQLYWQRRVLWALSYRTSLVKNQHHTSDISEAARYLLKEKILNKIKGFNNIQLVDFFLSKFTDYYKRRLLDAAHNRCVKDKLMQRVKLPAPDIVQNIQKLNGNMYLVPSEKSLDVLYIVYADLLICTCSGGSIGNICKHIEWLHIIYHSEEYRQKIDDIAIRTTLLEIVTEKIADQIWLLPVNKTEVSTPKPEEAEDSVVVMELEIQEECNDHLESLESEMTKPQIQDPDTEQQYKLVLEEGHRILNELAQRFEGFVNESPLEVVPLMKELLERTEKVKTVEELAILTCGPSTPLVGDETLLNCETQAPKPKRSRKQVLPI